MIAVVSFCENIHNLAVTYCLIPLPSWFCNSFRKASGSDPSCCRRIWFTTSSFIFLLLVKYLWCSIPRPLCCAFFLGKKENFSNVQQDWHVYNFSWCFHSFQQNTLIRVGEIHWLLVQPNPSRIMGPQRGLGYFKFMNMKKRDLFVISFLNLAFGFLSC